MIRLVLAAASRLWSRPSHAYRLPWCGFYMMHYFGKTDRRLALARNGAGEGANAGRPGAGVGVVWPHHVGEIRAGPNARGQWLVHSGNDGCAVRTRWRSLRGAIAFRWVR
jgi:hypothetical protein